ncbi:polyprenyl synthetase family protein [Plastorhodobacter daqingensis]|uniref:Polyprenyl synthetase family protein n=1 Tax=Plastorhodobacter daqingensis TaxID=1387281 RepID=A0ABW2UKI9_9RHOB
MTSTMEGIGWCRPDRTGEEYVPGTMAQPAAATGGDGARDTGAEGPGARGDDAVLRDGAWGHQARIEARLQEMAAGFGRQSPALGRAMSEALLAPGKRFRAMLMLQLAEASGAVPDALVDAACAIEMVHTASLILDDLPCMDDARLRRGQPASHVVHGESRAILAGIALITEANRLLAGARGLGAPERMQLVMILSDALGPEGLCAGQELDLHAEKTEAGVLREQDLKTGVLFVAGLSMLAVIRGLATPEAERLAGLARQIGRVFQCYDDLLDVLAEAATLGKDTGRDAAPGRGQGILATRGRAEATRHYEHQRAELDRILHAQGFPIEEIGRFIGRVLPHRAPA